LLYLIPKGISRSQSLRRSQQSCPENQFSHSNCR
jgi:hypothetical protein